MKSQIMLAVFLLGMVAINADTTPEEFGALVKSGVDVYGDFVGRLTGGVKDLYISEELTKFAKSFAKLDIEMNDSEKEGVSTILAINVDAQLAIDSSRVVVLNLKNVCDTLLLILDNFVDQEGLKAAIETYLAESKLLDPKIDKAIERLTTVIAKSIQVDAAIIKITGLTKRKQEEIVENINNMSAEEVQAELIKAYGGAAVCLAWGPLAVFACPISYAIATGVTQGVTIPNIIEGVNKKFDDTRATIEEVKTNINALGVKTKELVKNVEADKQSMLSIRDQMDNADRQGRLTQNPLLFQVFFEKFKTVVTTLMASCNAYLAVK